MPDETGEGTSPSAGGGAAIGETLIKSAASAKKKKARSENAISLADLTANVKGAEMPYVSDHKGPPLREGPVRKREGGEADEGDRPPFALHNRYRHPDKRDTSNWTVVHGPAKAIGGNRPVPLGGKAGVGRSVTSDPCAYINNSLHQQLDPATGRAVIDVLIRGSPPATTQPPHARRHYQPGAGGGPNGRAAGSAAEGSGGGGGFLAHDSKTVVAVPVSRRVGSATRGQWATSSQCIGEWGSAGEAAAAAASEASSPWGGSRAGGRQQQQQQRHDAMQWSPKTCPRKPHEKLTEFNRFAKSSVRGPMRVGGRIKWSA